MKNENEDMCDIMDVMHNFLGQDYPEECRLASGGDHLTCERQVGARKYTMNGNTSEARLDILEPVVEDWHCQLCIIIVST